MDVGADPGACLGGGLDRQLGAGPVDQHQFGAVRVEAGRAGLVILDMRVAVADDGAIGRAEGGQADAIGGGAGRHP